MLATMTVAELIDRLRELPPELPVILERDAKYYVPDKLIVGDYIVDTWPPSIHGVLID